MTMFHSSQISREVAEHAARSFDAKKVENYQLSQLEGQLQYRDWMAALARVLRGRERNHKAALLAEFAAEKWNPVKQKLKDFIERKLWILEQNRDQYPKDGSANLAMKRILYSPRPTRNRCSAWHR